LERREVAPNGNAKNISYTQSRQRRFVTNIVRDILKNILTILPVYDGALYRPETCQVLPTRHSWSVCLPRRRELYKGMDSEAANFTWSTLKTVT